MPSVQREHPNQVEGKMPHANIPARARSLHLAAMDMKSADAEQLGKPDSSARRNLKWRKLVRHIENLAALCGDKEVTQRLDDLAKIIACVIKVFIDKKRDAS